MPNNVASGLLPHGAGRVAGLVIDAYNAELRGEEGFLGDRASKRAFLAILDELREQLRRYGDDPLGEQDSGSIGKKRLDKLLVGEDAEAAALLHGAVEEFAQELAQVIRRFLRLKGWRGTGRIVVGGGLRGSRLGELAIARAGVILKAEGQGIELHPIHHHPDEAGLIGGAHLAPRWMFAGHEAVLAADIGGSNIRAGLVELNLKKDQDLRAARVMGFALWRHRDEAPTRDEAVARLCAMLSDLAARAEKDRVKLAPFVGIGCPGLIAADGAITRGGQNLPGNWEDRGFSLPARLQESLPRIGGEETVIVMHNDAVVQGLSEAPFTRDVAHWGVLTIGTGLGNARFSTDVAEERRTG